MRTLLRRFVTLAIAMWGLAPGFAQSPAPLAPVPVAAAAATVYVDDTPVNNAGVSCPGTPHTTLQAGFNAALDGATIYVCQGTYAAGVLINARSNLKLIGKGDVFVNAPLNFAGAFVNVTNSTNITVQGLIIDGGSNLHATSPSQAIQYYESSGSILKNYILHWRKADLSGVVAYHASVSVYTTLAKTIKVDHNTIYDAQVYGISVVGPNAPTISSNYIAITSDGAFTPFAIRLVYATGGSVKSNVVRSQGDMYAALSLGRGVILEESSNVKVTGNTVTGMAVGVLIASECLGGVATANNNLISKNKLYEGIMGVYLYVSDMGCAPHADNNKVTGNTITSRSRLNVTAVSSVSGGASPSVILLTVKSNTISGYTGDPITQTGSGAKSSVESGNKIRTLPPPGT